jgi:DNA-binding LacI/PurR family transcriptional regulator
MPETLTEIGQVKSQPGRPLYLSVRDAIRSAIDTGIFQPGQQIPSTKMLSEQMSVSLVTAHRAMRELVASGVLSRTQGKGTYVDSRYFQKSREVSLCRMGLVFHREASLADYYHGQVLEGVRQAANHLAVDLMLLRFEEDLRNECDGYLYVNPMAEQLETICADGRKQPSFVVGARPSSKKIASIDVDNVDIGRQAVMHLVSMGHREIGYVGGADEISNSADRWTGFAEAMNEQGLLIRECNVIKGRNWQLDDKERMALIRALSGPNRPTAIFAAGYSFALDVYTAAGTVGLRLPEQLSVVGVDDPSSAPHLSPPLTTLRQPLTQLGYAAVNALAAQIQKLPGEAAAVRMLWAELIIRRSSSMAPSQSSGSSRKAAPIMELAGTTRS